MTGPRFSSLIAVALLTVAPVACSSSGGTAGGKQANGGGAGGRRGLALAEQWSWLAPPPAYAGMPTADASGVALTSGHRQLALLDDRGTTRWQADRIGVRDVAPALTAELVLAATDDGVVAYDRGSGRRRWEASLAERANTPVVAGGVAVVTTWEGTLAGLDLADGRVMWRLQLGGDALGPVAARGPTVVATFDSGRVAGAVAVDAISGRQRWRVPLPPGGVSAPAIGARGTVVVVAADVAAHGLSLEDGGERWRRPTGGAGSPEVPPLPLPDGTVLVAHRLGGMAMLDSDDGKVLWEASAGGAAAVRGGPAGPGPMGWFALPLDDGRLMLGGADRKVETHEPPGLVTGVANGPGGLLLVATGQGEANGLSAMSGW